MHASFHASASASGEHTPQQSPQPHQPQAQPAAHLSRPAPSSLPPRVRGQPRGFVSVTVDEVVWFPSSSIHAPSRQSLDHGTTIVRLRWWGEQGEGALWTPSAKRMDAEGNILAASVHFPERRKPPAQGSQEFETLKRAQAPTVTFPIVVSPNTFTNYLNDAQWLVFDVYHFVETDPAAIHREFLKTLQRAAHPNRSLPQVKQPLGHVMFDLAPLCDSLACGEEQWVGVKNLPMLVNGTPVGQVSVRMMSRIDSSVGAAPRPHWEQQQQLSSDFLPPQQADPFSHSGSASSVSSFAQTQNRGGMASGGQSVQNSPAASSVPRTLPRSSRPAFAGSERHPAGSLASNGGAFDLSHLIEEAQEMAQQLGGGEHMDVEEYIKQQQQERQQSGEEKEQLREDSKQHQSPSGMHFQAQQAPPTFEYSRPAANQVPSRSVGQAAASSSYSAASAFPSHLSASSHAAPSLSSSHSHSHSQPRPFSHPPAFSSYTPAPAHFFPDSLPTLPSVVDGDARPFVGREEELAVERARAEVMQDGSGPVESLVDAGGLVTIWFRVRKVTLHQSAHEKERQLGGRGENMHEVQAHLQHRVNPISGDVVAGVEELIASKRKQHANAHPRDVEASSSEPAAYMVLHYHFFPDLLMNRTPALFAPLRGTERPAYFHCADSTPRVYSRSLLSSLSSSAFPLEVYAYRRKPSWKDARERETGRFVPKAPQQTILARTEIPYRDLARLPTAWKSGGGSGWIIRFLSTHVALSTTLPLFAPNNPSPQSIGTIEFALGWGTPDDLSRITRMEAGAIKAQALVRGFLVRRRQRRRRIEEAIREENEEAAAGAEQFASFPSTAAAAAPVHTLASPSHAHRSSTPAGGAGASSSPSLIATPRDSPGGSPRSVAFARGDVSQRDAVSSSPRPATTSTKPVFHLNLPTSGRKHPIEERQAERTPRKSAMAQTQAAPAVTAPSLPVYPAPLPFTPAARALDSKDFVSYTYGRSKHVPAVKSKENSLNDSVRSFHETLAEIQAQKESAARATASPPRSPLPTSSPTRLIRVGSPPAPAVSARGSAEGRERQQRIAREAERELEERKQKHQADTQELYHQLHQEEEKQNSAFSSPPRSRGVEATLTTPSRSPTRSNPSSTYKSSASSSTGGPVGSPTRAQLGLEEFSDVDVEEYEDDWTPVASPARSAAGASSLPASALSTSYTPPSLSLSFLPAPYSPASHSSPGRAKERLRKQLEELEDMRRRMERRLEGEDTSSGGGGSNSARKPTRLRDEPSEDDEKRSVRSPEYSSSSAAKRPIRSPDRPKSPVAVTMAMESPSSMRAKHSSSPAAAPMAALGKPYASASPLPTSQTTTHLLSPSASPAPAAGHHSISDSTSASPGWSGRTPSHSPLGGDHQSGRASASPRVGSARSEKDWISPGGGSTRAAGLVLARSPQPYVAAPSSEKAKTPSPAPGVSPVSSIHEELAVPMPSPHDSPSIAAGSSASKPQVASRPVADAAHDSDDDVSSLSDVDSLDDSSHDDDEEESDSPPVDRSRWGMRATVGDIDVEVRYAPGGGSQSGERTAQVNSAERARLFPHGLPSQQGSSAGSAAWAAEDSHQPGARSSLTSSASATVPRWDPAYRPSSASQLSEEEAKRLERIAKIMAE